MANTREFFKTTIQNKNQNKKLKTKEIWNINAIFFHYEPSITASKEPSVKILFEEMFRPAKL